MKNHLCNETIPVFPHQRTSHLYRIRVASDFDKTDITQFGYIQDTSKIKRQRLNKEGEQVLYTSSYPTIAERETISEKDKDFFLTKFKKKACKDNFLSFVAIDDNCSCDPLSDSRMLRNDILRRFTVDELCGIDKLRNILEKNYDENDTNKYEESSECASEILKVANCIITYSKVGGNGDKYLNLTFNKYAADNLLEIETIYHCRAKKDQTSLEYDIIEIGLPAGRGKIKWYDYYADNSSICIEYHNGFILKTDDILRFHNNRLMPFVNYDIAGEFRQTIIIPSKGKYTLRYHIELIEQK